MANIPVKIRKGKNGNSFYCRLWNGEKQNTETITLGKETKEFTLTEAIKKYENIKNLFKEKKWNYKDYLLEEEKQNIILKNKNELTFEKVFYSYFDKKLTQKEDEFIKLYKNRLNITRDNFEETTQWQKKLRAWNSKKNSFESYLIARTYNFESVLKKDGTQSKILKKYGIKEKEYIANKLFVELNKEDIEYIHKKLKQTKYKEKYLEAKTIVNILNQFKTIIAWGIEEKELNFINPFFKIKKEERKELLKDQKLRRERILTDSELLTLFNTLYFLPNKNAFIGALLGFVFCSRAETVLNIRKIDFEPEFENNEYFYTNVNLMNMKTHKFYTCPVPKGIGKFLYQYLINHELEEYVLRPKREGSRTKKFKPLSQISEDYYKTADYLFFYVKDMKIFIDKIDKQDKALLILRKDYLKNRLKNQYLAKSKEAQINQILKEKKLLEEILKKSIEKLKLNKEYVRKKHFDFHSLRHQLASQMTKYNFQYTKYLLSHSEQSNRTDEISLRYSKIDFNDLKEKLTLITNIIVENILINSEEMNLYKNKINHKENFEEYKEKQKNFMSLNGLKFASFEFDGFTQNFLLDNELAEEILLEKELEKEFMLRIEKGMLDSLN